MRTVDSILSFARAHEAEMAATIRRFVECESPSDDAAAVSRFVELVSDTVAPFAKVKTYSGGRFGRLMVAEMQLPGRRKSGQVLALGHSDTVWPIGTLRSMPFRQTDGRLWGPGVLDMKAGIVFFLFAVRALRELDIAAGSKVLLQLNPDEEVGSERFARAHGEERGAQQGGAGAGAGHRTDGQVEDGAQRRGRFPRGGEGARVARGGGFRGGRERGAGTGAADRHDRGLHAIAARHHGESGRDRGGNAE